MEEEQQSDTNTEYQRLAIKLMEWYISSYTIEEVISTKSVKLRLLVLMRIHPVVNFSRVMRYKNQWKSKR